MSDVNTFFAAISDSAGNFFLIDVISSEEHKFESEVTEFPLESGGDFTDNVRPKPIEVSMECLVSDTPLQTIARARQQTNATKQTLADASNFAVLSAVANGTAGSPPPPPNTPSKDALAFLMAIRGARLPVSIITSLRRYDNMVLRDLAVPRAPGQATSLRFTATFVQVTVVENRRFVKVSAPRAMAPRVVQDTPKPADKNQNYNDTLPVYNVMGLADGNTIWLDEEGIGGWRYDAAHDPPSEANNSSAPRTGSAYNPAQEGWVMYRGRPFGVSTDDWYNNRKYDYEYREMIRDAYEHAPRDPDGDPAAVSSNPYDPRDPFGISAGQAWQVHGRIATPIRNPALRGRHK